MKKLKINIEEKEFYLSSLTIGDFIQFGEILERFNKNELSVIEQAKFGLDIIYASLKRHHKDLKKDDLLDILELDHIAELLPKIFNLSEFIKKESEEKNHENEEKKN
jgi:hypothetical protein